MKACNTCTHLQSCFTDENNMKQTAITTQKQKLGCLQHMNAHTCTCKLHNFPHTASLMRVKQEEDPKSIKSSTFLNTLYVSYFITAHPYECCGKHTKCYYETELGMM